MSGDACVVCGRVLSTRPPSGCCSGRCRAQKSRDQADARRRRELTDVLAGIEALRTRVVALLESR